MGIHLGGGRTGRANSQGGHPYTHTRYAGFGFSLFLLRGEEKGRFKRLTSKVGGEGRKKEGRWVHCMPLCRRGREVRAWSTYLFLSLSPGPYILDLLIFQCSEKQQQGGGVNEREAGVHGGSGIGILLAASGLGIF